MDTSIFLHTMRYRPKFVIIICLRIFGFVKCGDRINGGAFPTKFQPQIRAYTTAIPSSYIQV